MNEQQIAAERGRFVEACPEFPQTKMAVFGDPQFMFSHTRVAERAWMKRADIAHAEQAELQAEIDRLRDRVRELDQQLATMRSSGFVATASSGDSGATFREFPIIIQERSW